MATKQKSAKSTIIKRQRPATSPEDREKQMISLAINKVEERMLNDTASAQEYVHYLKLASSKEKLEKEKLELELELVKAKTENLKSAKHIEELYTEAMEAFRRYGGNRD